ncbi:MAG TPA: hypothetical protein VFB36_12965, partial [Nevskiaceae bacterium]|nr:hypothetical protein [Nevskiaceae bacterium]
LYDYPRVAPESPGDLFDATEIDEMLMLRLQTLADSEVAELADAEPRVRALLERAHTLPPDQMQRLHGAMRTSDVGLAKGARVRLKPRRHGDIMDVALAGKEATVIAVEHDFDGGVHVAVVLDDDPGADLGEQGFHGHRFFFQPSEVEPL